MNQPYACQVGLSSTIFPKVFGFIDRRFELRPTNSCRPGSARCARLSARSRSPRTRERGRQASGGITI